MSKKREKIRDEVWQQSSEITRSQIFASGTVQKWLELADKAFETDKLSPEEPAIPQTTDSVPQEFANPKVEQIRPAEDTPPKRARAKSA